MISKIINAAQHLVQSYFYEQSAAKCYFKIMQLSHSICKFYRYSIFDIDVTGKLIVGRSRLKWIFCISLQLVNILAISWIIKTQRQNWTLAESLIAWFWIILQVLTFILKIPMMSNVETMAVVVISTLDYANRQYGALPLLKYKKDLSSLYFFFRQESVQH